MNASIRAVKRQVTDRILSPAWRGDPAFWSDLPRPAVVRALLGLLARREPLLRWRAVASLGPLLASLAAEEPEAARGIMRRLVWSLNEESGAVGFGAPEALAEAMYHSPPLAAEFGNLLCSYLLPGHNQLDFPPLVAGALWGLARLAPRDPAAWRRCCPARALAPCLSHPDATVRGQAVRALAALADPVARPGLERLRGDAAELSYWQDGTLVSRPVGELAREALAGLSGAGA